MPKQTRHPADEIAKTLARASGICTVLSGCFDQADGHFEASPGFVFESLLAIEGMLQKANDAVARLYQTCDLTVLREIPVEPETPVVVPVSENGAEPTIQLGMDQQAPEPSLDQPMHMPFAPKKSGSFASYFAQFGPSDEKPALAAKVSQFAPGEHFSETAKNSQAKRPARSYDELLQKLTAVADQAAFHAQSSPTDRTLLPALEDLRTDLIKLRAVA